MSVLQEEAELEEIVKLVGMDALSAADRLKLETARSVREDFLHQNAFDETDTYTSLFKQYLMMKLIMNFYDKAFDAVKKGASIEKIVAVPSRESIGRFKYVPEENIENEYSGIITALEKDMEEALTAADTE